jgi:hypothetical protein
MQMQLSCIYSLDDDEIEIHFQLGVKTMSADCVATHLQLVATIERPNAAGRVLTQQIV